MGRHCGRIATNHYHVSGVNHISETTWVVVAGGIHREGGMDRCNWALARHLIQRGDRVHLVCHHADANLLNGQSTTIHIVAKPARSFMLGGLLLSAAGRKIALEVSRLSPQTRVVINGGNCNWPDINWVHCVHHAWRHTESKSSRSFFRPKIRLYRRLSCRHERAALRRARILIANSERTRHDLIDALRIEPDRIHTVYPGVDSDFLPPSPA